MSAHTQNQENEFIKSLVARNGMSRADVLQGYIAGCKKRTKWGDLDKSECISVAQKQIDIEPRK